jgi:UDP-N-acetylglucosamine:LPS N-acetylglucosamine transferase
VDHGERKPQILFAAIAAGGGHVATAKAMAQAIEVHYPGRFELRVSDYMKELPDERVVTLDRKNKRLWRFLLRYPLLARIGQRLMDASPRLTISGQRRAMRPFAKAAARDLRENPPLLVVSNHGILTAGFGEAKHRYGLDVPVLSYVNELCDICSYWADPRAEHTVVPTEKAMRDLLAFGIPPEKLTLLGYPVAQPFLDMPSKSEARESLGLEDRFTCVVSFGAEGLSPRQKEMVVALLDCGFQVVVIAGKNDALRADLKSLGRDALTVEGYVDDVATRLAAGDVFVGKAGPASVYEAFAAGLPILITGYAGLNELGTTRRIESLGLGEHVRSPAALAKTAKKYASNPRLLEEAARRCREQNVSESTETLAHYIVRYATEGKPPERGR